MAAKKTKTGEKVDDIAKALGLDPKDILAKLKAEGLDWARNKVSVLSFGQAETVREWYKSGELGGGAAVAVEEAPASKTARKTSRKHAESDAETGEGETGTAVAEPPEEVVEKEIAPDVVTAEVAPQEPAPALRIAPQVIAPPAPPVAPPAAVEQPKVAAEAPAPVTPAPTTPPVPAVVAPHKPKHDVRQPVVRETVTLANRKPVAPARPVAFTPKPAQLQGPRVVREEKPDIVAKPRPKLRGPEQQGPQPGFSTAQQRTGRGVKRSDDEEETESKDKDKKGARGSLSTRRRGADGRRGEADEKLREFSDADLIERSERIANAGKSREEFDRHLKKSSARGTHTVAKSAAQKGEPIELEEPVTVRNFAAALGIKTNEVITKLMRQGVMANINQALDPEVAAAMAMEYGIELIIKPQATLAEILEKEFEARGMDESKLQPRPPVVTILGHVDHGKTSLLDRIRKANVAAGEAGGITQHTAAWMVTLGEGEKQKRVTFIDTPGHQAFTSMRARGANMTDVVVLVVSAAEGVQPQTVESINHARAAEVPIVVAMNKIDRPDANEQQVLGQLAANGLNPSEWGGDTDVIRTSATTGQGIAELIEVLDYQAELLALKSDPTAPATGSVIEAKMEPGLGSAATVLVQDGTLKVGDILVCGKAYGKIRTLLNDRGQMIQEATASMPVIVAGITDLPSAGDKFYITDDMERARQIASERSVQDRQVQLALQNRATGANLLSTLAAGDAKTINLIIKADVQGSIETLVATVTGQNTEEVKVRIVHSGVGAISESDVHLAMATKAKPTDNRVAIIGFHVVPDEAARALAEQNHIDVKTYRVIYEIFDDLKKSLSGMLAPEIREKYHGRAEVRKVYRGSKIGSVAGCMVIDGHIQRGSKIRLVRNGAIVTEDLSIESLKRVKDDVKEVKQGFECGIKIAGYDDIKEGDVLEAYIREKFERTL